MPELIVTFAITIVPIFVAYHLGYKKGYRRAAKKAAEYWDPFKSSRISRLFEGEYAATEYPQLGSDYDVSADGQRFLMVKETARTVSSEQINVVLNWLEELKRRVPTN